MRSALARTITAALATSFSTIAVQGLNSCLSASACAAGSTSLPCPLSRFLLKVMNPMTSISAVLVGNHFTAAPTGMGQDSDVDDLQACLASVGHSNIEYLDVSYNDLTTLPSDLFAGMGSLSFLYLQHNALTSLDANLFDDLVSASFVHLANNVLTTLPAGVFDNLGSGTLLEYLVLAGNDDLQCLPLYFASGSWHSSQYTTGNYYGEPVSTPGLCGANLACFWECTPADAVTCDVGSNCNAGAEGYTCDAFTVCANDGDCDTDAGEECCLTKLICEVPDTADPGACGDPHMTGFRGQKFDFTGKDGGWYAVVSDLPYMHLNMRVTAPVPSLPEITYITGISVSTTDADGVDHSIVISVKKPHSMDSACPTGMASCLADGALNVVVDGDEVMRTPDTVTIAPDVAIAAVNLPGACRSFGFEQYWERKKLEYLAQSDRKLDLVNDLQGMSDWVLADPTATNVVECAEYVARVTAVGDVGLFDHQSEHVSFQIMTPTTTIRLSHGRLHQLPMRDPTDQYDLPDHLAWQMNLAIDHSDMSLDATGILGETLVPTLDEAGASIMHGMGAIRGAQEDYRVSGPLEVLFAQDQRQEE